MSELIDARGNQKTIRRQMLSTVSMLALLPCAWSGAKAANDDADRPTVWIELGGQLERQTGQGDVYTPPFAVDYASSPAFKPVSPFQAERPPLFSNGGEGKLSFEPEGSDWVFSASFLYGRANGDKAAQQTAPKPVAHFVTRSNGHCCVSGTRTLQDGAYADMAVTHRDAHAILDFQAGKEVGLGLFGQNSNSLLSVGVRFAQFVARSSATLHARPDITIHNGELPFLLHKYPNLYFPVEAYHVFAATAQSARSFHGLGPEISWNSSLALIGNRQAGEFSFDWGANVAVLFGRHKAKGQHHESGRYATKQEAVQSYYSNPVAPFDRSRTVTVPNVGGFAGMSLKFPNAKVSLGYRADLFFGAMDTGIDTEMTKNVSFYGPFASISIGIGG